MANNSGAAPPLTVEAAVYFQEGINLLLSRWTALQMAILNEWGGPQSRLKSQQLALDLFSFLAQSKEKVYIDDVEDFLDDAMLSLDTEVDDGSIEEVAEQLMLMHEGCVQGDFSSIMKLRAMDPPKVAVTPRGPEASSDSDDDDDDMNGNHDGKIISDNDGSSMMVDAPQLHSNSDLLEMAVDGPGESAAASAEDGWTVVASKRNRGRRN